MTFRLLTWNCFGAAQGLRDALRERAPVGRRLQDPEVQTQCNDTDVLCLQELLSGEAQSFFERARHPFFRYFCDDNAPRFRPPSLRGTGLGTCSRASFDAPSVWNFNSSFGLDRLARKGALHTRITLGKRSLDVVNVHLQSGYEPGALLARSAQLAELRRWLDEFSSPERDLLICGDLNIDGLTGVRGEEYRTLASILHDFDDLGAPSDLPTFHAHPDGNELAHHFEPEGWTQRLDYILHRPAREGAILRLSSLERTLDRPLLQTAPPPGLRSAWASDHYALRATFTVAP